MSTTTRLFTLAEYLAYDDGTDRWYELENGELRLMSSESDLNNQIAMYLIGAFLKFISTRLLRRGTEIVVSGSRATVRIPDLLVLTEESATALTDATRSLITSDMPPPALVVEVVSPGTENQNRDYRYKRSEYAARGISEYWLIDPQQKQVIVLTLIDGLYEEAIFRDQDCIISVTFPQLALTANQILQIEAV
ncbi:MAG: Uma2 family endonuclease [Cyanobacteria bacterium J06621_8]